MNELSLFSGAGGGLLATKYLLGFKCVGYAEKDEYCKKILRARIADGLLDDAPIFNDVRYLDGLRYRGKVDIVTAGFPCQPFSVAGKRKGADDERNCWPDTIRIIREVQPRYAYLENVPGLAVSGYFGTILQDLSESGFNAKWCVLSASKLGAPHRRRRLWIFAYADSNGFERQKLHLRWRRQDETALESGRDSTKVADPDSSRSRFGFEESSRWSKFKFGTSWWDTEPDVGRVANGVAARVDRLKAIGNGQVPVVAATAFKILSDDL